MSNDLAIAAVTSTLRYVLDRALQHPHPGPVGSATVTTLRPDHLGDTDLVHAPGINVFLYQVTSNHAWNLTDLPTRRPDGSFLRRPIAALDLHYLLTCYGEDASLDGQRLLGTAVTALSVTPVFTHDTVAAAMAAYRGAPETGFLNEADLADQVESVKLSLTALSLEELSRLWSLFLQTPYQLSATCTATVVLLEAGIAPRTALPVRQRAVTVSVGGPPRLTALDTETPCEAAVEGSVLALRGSGLLGPETRVRIGPARLPPGPGATSSLLTATLDQSVPAGVHPVQVLHLSRPGPQGMPPTRLLNSSNALPVTVRPTVTAVRADATDVTVDLSPPLLAGQRATVGLSRIAGGSPTARDTLSFVLPPVADAAQPQSSVQVSRSDVPDGEWLVRVQVDGVDSLPERVGEVYQAPSLTLASL